MDNRVMVFDWILNIRVSFFFVKCGLLRICNSNIFHIKIYDPRNFNTFSVMGILRKTITAIKLEYEHTEEVNNKKIDTR